MIALVLLTAPALAQERGGARAGVFDFYVLSLSWSPHYCEEAGSSADPNQCAVARPKGFVVHGLWPQYNRGWPAYCLPEPIQVSRETVNSILDVIPSAGLIRYQWRKHGSCSGLGPAGYFSLVRRAAAKIRIPGRFANPAAAPDRTAARAVADAFIRENPGLRADMLSVQCDGGALKEVRICLTKDAGNFISCPEVARRSCRRSPLEITRGAAGR